MSVWLSKYATCNDAFLYYATVLTPIHHCTCTPPPARNSSLRRMQSKGCNSWVMNVRRYHDKPSSGKFQMPGGKCQNHFIVHRSHFDSIRSGRDESQCISTVQPAIQPVHGLWWTHLNELAWNIRSSKNRASEILNNVGSLSYSYVYSRLICIYVYIYIYVCVYIYIYIYIHIKKLWLIIGDFPISRSAIYLAPLWTAIPWQLACESSVL